MTSEQFHLDLQHTLDSVNHWLKFAETKNAGLLTLTLALLLGLEKADLEGLVSLLIPGRPVNLSAILFGVPIFMCLCSFMPRFSEAFIKKGSPGTDDNLLFYKHAANYSAADYLKAFYKRWAAGQSVDAGDLTGLNTLGLDYAGQIVTNSTIAVAKYRIFTWALWIYLVGVADVILGLALN